MLPRSIRSITSLLAVFVTFPCLLRPAIVEAQGQRAGLAPMEWSPPTDAGERVRAEGYRAARLSRGARGALIGMAIGAAVGAGLGYLACTDEQAELPCPHLIPVFGTGGLVLGALVGFSVGIETRWNTTYLAPAERR